MNSPLITVLITTFNYGQFIEQAIDSVFSQDFPLDRVQVVVVDDGSTDDTSERVKKYGRSIEYFFKPNGGQASALNLGFDKARGDVVALLDADDFFLPGKLARVAEVFEQDPDLGMAYHRLREWHMETNTYSDLSFQPTSGYIRSTPYFFASYVTCPTSCLAFRRTSLSPFLPIPEDIRMLADCFPNALIPFLAPVLAVPEFLSMYRIHGNNSYYDSDRDMPLEVRRTRLEMWQTVISAMFGWLAANGFTRKQLSTKVFIDRWTLFLEDQLFLVTPPARLRLSRHLMRYNSCYRAQMGWHIQVVHYLKAILAFCTGYRLYHFLDGVLNAKPPKNDGKTDDSAPHEALKAC
jgi:hypothetical protein